MGEALLVKAGAGGSGSSGGGSSGGAGNSTIITSNGYYVVGASGNYRINAVGGGGGNAWYANNWGGWGASGFFNTATVYLNSGENILVTIGKQGSDGSGYHQDQDPDWPDDGYENTIANSGTNGGITSFGSWVSANGGSGGIGHWDKEYANGKTKSNNGKNGNSGYNNAGGTLYTDNGFGVWNTSGTGHTNILSYGSRGNDGMVSIIYLG